MKNLDAVGAAIDAALAKLGVTLTAGGEPTLIANNHEHPEWNVAALGPTKLSFARLLARELTFSLAPGSLITHTMGKQYPGEPIPRWAVNLHWRKDGGSLAPRNLFRFDSKPVHHREDAKKFADALSASMKLKGAFQPAYENIAATLDEQPFFDPKELQFELPRFSPEQLKKMRAAAQPIGWVLPLDGGKDNWRAIDWPLSRPDSIVLIPGESPLGLRLPLYRLPEGVSRCALTVEVRNNELCVFIPPVGSQADYWDLLNHIRAASKQTKIGHLVIEGYEPPSEGSLVKMSLVADPGVLEINLPPSADFAGYKKYVDALYEGAAKTGLRPYKYQYTGRKVGTGGGAHILLGGATLDTNPFFLNPKLLASFIRYLQHHPSLSFFFTGMFIGPSSQAPRVDESAYEIPYEIEIALHGLEKMETPANRSLMDLMLRNLLMDTLGNTHRAEISVDKLWNPYAPNGCLGLIEFRAFEMPPNSNMLMAAVALLRGLAAMFLKQPFVEPLKKWGIELHDTHSMPWFLVQDLEAVLADLRKAGFDFSFDLFKDWFEFRFPSLGTLRHDKHEIEFRQALEPWPVLGEQPNGGGTSRFVDPSMDRLQIIMRDLAWSKNYLLLANGVPLSFHKIPGKDLQVGAVRYRMFYCVPGLQPHIGAQSPLLFELVDVETFRVVAAKKLINWRPDQQNYAGLPQNDEEAKARVSERFFDTKETVGQLRYITLKPKLVEAIYTTDLRFFV